MIKKPLILIAEDDLDDVFLLKTAFNECSSEEDLEFVPNGVELLNALHTRLNDDKSPIPDLIMLDLNMPLKDGKEALSEIKLHPVLKKIPVLVYTTTRNEHEIKKCYELGANSYIMKPTTFEQLVSVVSIIRNYWLITVCRPASLNPQEISN